MNTLRLFFSRLLGMLVLPVSVWSQTANTAHTPQGNHTAKTLAVWPQQSYAVIDLSKNMNLDADLMAFENAQHPLMFGGYIAGTSIYQTFRWLNGQVSQDDAFDTYVESTVSNPSGTKFESRWAAGFSTNGKIYGSISVIYEYSLEDLYENFSDWPGFQQGFTRPFDARFEAPNPPFVPYDVGIDPDNPVYAGVYNLAFKANSGYAGYAKYVTGFLSRAFCEVVNAVTGMHTVFMGQSNPGITSSPNNVALRTEVFEPYQMIADGWAVGATRASWSEWQNHGAYWNGSSLVDLGAGYAFAINQQHQIIGRALEWDGNFALTSDQAYLFENGHKVILQETLPKPLRGQLKNLQPLLISDQPSSNDDSVNIVFSADSLEGILPGQWVSRRFIWHRDQADIVTVAQINLPDGVLAGLSAISPAGVIAGIGQPGEFSSISHAMLLPPVEIAPEILKMNGNFDEGHLDSQTGYALRDCDDDDLKADRDSYHDTSIKNGKIVTKDLHKNFFGARPDTLPEGWESGAVIVIEKLSETDPETNRPETGEIRLYAIKNLDQVGEQDWVIQLTEGTPENPHPRNLVSQLYGPNATIPKGDDVGYWMEGIKPGPITLEFKYTKDSFTFSHKQKFKVVTEQSKAAWQQEARNEILLETQGRTDINNYQVAGGPLIDLFQTKYFAMNKENVNAVYKHYEKVYMVGQQKYLWAGLAKLAGAPVYAGLSDAQWGRLGGYVIPPIMRGVSGAVLKDIQTTLVRANIDIYQDLAWQFAAYRCSGLTALKYARYQAPSALNYAAWEEIDDGIFEQDQSKISNGNIELLRREQRDILARTYADLDAIGFGLVSWLFSILAENPVPGGPDFSSWYELRLISSFNKRWDWITRSGDGMWPLWTAASTNTRKGWVKIPLRTRADEFNLVPLAPIW